MPIIDRDSPVAMYLQIAEDIAGSLHTRSDADSRLSSETELMATYGVSRITVRLALAHLVERGLLVRKQGKGTFVNTPRFRQSLQRLTGFHDTLVAQGIHPETRLLEFGPREAPPEVQRQLRLPAAETLYFCRQYIVDGRPLAVSQGYFMPAMMSLVTREIAERHPTYTIFRQFAEIEIDRADVTIRAQAVDGELAGLLGVPPRSAALVLERLTYTSHDTPCEHTLLYLRADAYEFNLTVEDGLPLMPRVRANARAERGPVPAAVVKVTDGE